jgi:hypothetical protein
MASTGPPRRNSGISGSGGRRRIRADVVTVSGTVSVQAFQALRTAPASAVRPERRAREHLRGGQQADLDRLDDAEVSAAAPQRPEQVRVVVAVHAAQDAVGADELDGQHVVGGEAVAARVERQAAAEQVAHDADVR